VKGATKIQLVNYVLYRRAPQTRTSTRRSRRDRRVSYIIYIRHRRAPQTRTSTRRSRRARRVSYITYIRHRRAPQTRTSTRRSRRARRVSYEFSRRVIRCMLRHGVVRVYVSFSVLVFVRAILSRCP